MNPGWRLAIDFGTSNTTAAWTRRGEEVAHVLPLDSGRETLRSDALLTEDGSWLVGGAARRAAHLQPHRLVRSPKRRLGGAPILIGERLVPSLAPAAAVLFRVRLEARQAFGGDDPEEVVLTCPAQWGPERVDALVGAAVEAGFPRGAVRIVPEPVAAALRYGAGSPLADGARIAVFDFGGGTLDAAVLERDPRHPEGYAVVGVDGDPHLGGKDFDDRLTEWARDRLRERFGGGVDELLEDPGSIRHALALEEAVTAAKEDLSSAAAATVPVSLPGVDAVLTITKDEYETLIRPDVERAAALVRALLDGTGTRRLERLYLTGGSSRTPLVHRVLAESLGIAPATLLDRKLVVAEGALLTGSGAPGAAGGGMPEGGRAPEGSPPAGGADAHGDGGPPGARGDGGLGGPPADPVPLRPAAPPRRRAGRLALALGGGLVGLVAVAVVAGMLLAGLRPPADDGAGGGGPGTEVSAEAGPESPGPSSAAAAPPADPDCWAGPTAAGQACPPLTGPQAAIWIAGLTGAPACEVVQLDYLPNALESVRCTWIDHPELTVDVSRFPKGAQIREWQNHYAGRGAVEAWWPTADQREAKGWSVVTPGQRFGAEVYDVHSYTLIYESAPFSIDFSALVPPGADSSAAFSTLYSRAQPRLTAEILLATQGAG